HHRVIDYSWHRQPIRIGEAGCALKSEASRCRIPGDRETLSISASGHKQCWACRYRLAAGNARGLGPAERSYCRICELAVANLNAIDVERIDFIVMAAVGEQMCHIA